jgi:hypothetical protein
VGAAPFLAGAPGNILPLLPNAFRQSLSGNRQSPGARFKTVRRRYSQWPIFFALRDKAPPRSGTQPATSNTPPA